MHLKRPVKVLFALTGILALSACAGTGSGSSDRDPRVSEFDGTDCFNNRGIRRFEGLNNRNLIIYAEGGRAYHVELVTPSQNLDSEYRIFLSELDQDGRICPNSGDAVVIQGPFDERVPIGRIDRLDDQEVDELKNQFGKLDPEDL